MRYTTCVALLGRIKTFLCIFSDSFAILAAYCLELPTNSVSIYVYLSINGKNYALKRIFYTLYRN